MGPRFFILLLVYVACCECIPVRVTTPRSKRTTLEETDGPGVYTRPPYTGPPTTTAAPRAKTCRCTEHEQNDYCNRTNPDAATWTCQTGMAGRQRYDCGTRVVFRNSTGPPEVQQFCLQRGVDYDLKENDTVENLGGTKRDICSMRPFGRTVLTDNKFPHTWFRCCWNDLCNDDYGWHLIREVGFFDRTSTTRLPGQQQFTKAMSQKELARFGLYTNPTRKTDPPKEKWWPDFPTTTMSTASWTTKPATEPATKPATEPVTEPATEPATEPITEPATEPVTEPIIEPVTGPVTEPTIVQRITSISALTAAVVRNGKTSDPACAGVFDAVAETLNVTCLNATVLVVGGLSVLAVGAVVAVSVVCLLRRNIRQRQ